MKLYLLLVGVYSFKILVYNFTSMAQCPDKGVELEILLAGLNYYNLVENVDYSLECVENLQDAYARLASEDAVLFGGIRISEKLMVSGYSYTHPTYYSGLNVLINEADLHQTFRLFHAFSIYVWAIYALTPMFIGLLSWVCAFILKEKSNNEQFSWSSMLSYIWEAYSAWMFSGSITPSKAGRFLEMILSFFMFFLFLILVSSFAANTYQTLIPYISSFGDLAGQQALVDPQYQDMCGDYSIYYYTFNGDFFNDFDQELEMLSQGLYWGIITDITFLLEQMQQNSGFTINTYPFIYFSYAGLYGTGASTNTTYTINNALTKIQETSQATLIAKSYNLFYSISDTTQDQVVMSDCYVLFSVIGIACVLAIILSVIPLNDFYMDLWENCCKRKLQFFDELEITIRTESMDNYRKKYEIENEKLESSWASDMPDDFVRLIKTSTLSIIEYENISLEWVDKLIQSLRESNEEKLMLIKEIEDYLK